MNLNWVIGLAPKDLDPLWTQAVIDLFMTETKEKYLTSTLRSLPVEPWAANLFLVDGTGPENLQGLMWTSKLSPEIIRVVAFAIRSELQGNGWGSQCWEHFVTAAKQSGFSMVQLEVRSENTRAIEFYKRRGLEVITQIKGYYKSGLGLMMRGPI